MSTTTDIATSGSKLKDLVVTAAVASVVTALVAPWIRRWMDGPIAKTTEPAAPSPAAAPVAAGDFDARLERLLEVPNPFSGSAPTERPVTTRTQSKENEEHEY